MTTGTELRMYFFVPYNLSPIQQGIQAGHAAVEYARNYGDSEQFIDFADNHKTWIILNGGTTNTGFYENENGDRLRKGSLNNIADSLIGNGINCGVFHEPDLNDALSAVCFIADERVFNYELYPDFKDWLIETQEVRNPEFINAKNVIDLYPEEYEIWFNQIGGAKNIFLRDLLRNKKFA